MITTTIDSNLRLAAQRKGLLLIKKRDKKYAPGVESGYMILKAGTKVIVAGHKYKLSNEKVRDFLNKY